MKLFTTANEKSLREIATKNLDGVIFGVHGLSQRIEGPVSLPEVTTLSKIAKANGLEVYLNLNAILHEDDLDKLDDCFSYLAKNSENIDGILFADLAVFETAKSVDLTDKLIYYPETYLTNPGDVAFWNNEQIKSVVLTREMTLEDIKTIGTGSNMPLTIIGHGYLNMFHSKRRLIKSFFDYTKKQHAKKYHNKVLKLKEEIREEQYPIIQDDFGTHVFRANPLASFKVLESLKPHVAVFVVDGMLFGLERHMKILDDYVRALAGETVDSSAYHDHDDGFYFKKTVYEKGKEPGHDQD